MREQRCAMTVLIVGAVTVASHAASIGVNFHNGHTLAPTDVAGVTGVAQENWNNMTINNVDANGHNNSGSITNLIDNDGNAVANMTIDVSATGSTKVYRADGAGWDFTGGDLILQSSHFHPQPKITITDIPYAQYDVYIYVGAGGSNGDGMATITANSAGVVDATSTYWYHFRYENGNYVQATNTTGTNIERSNYILWTGNTASDITIDWDGKIGSGSWTGTKGIQIVNTIPEPTTLALLAGVLGMMRKRRAA